MNYQHYFKEKKIVIMGLGLLGRGVNVAKFLAECGAELFITDLKTGEQLEESLEQLKNFSNISYRLGRHELADFRKGDMVIRAANVPLDSPYIAEARKHGIPIKMDASLFAELAPEGVVLVGVTGTRGKTTTTQLIFSILQAAKKRAFLGGNIRGMATLPLLKEVRSCDIVVMELDSWQLQGFDEAKFSPQIAVFTNFFPDHLNYYKGDLERYWQDKVAIFSHQKVGDTLIVSEQIVQIMSTLGSGTSECARFGGGREVVEANDLPQDWTLRILGEHNRKNAALALMVARVLGVSDEISREALKHFAGVPGRLQFVCAINGVTYYNDTTATSPEATIAALRALADYAGRIVLIGGGADKGLSYGEWGRAIKEYCKGAVLFCGDASKKMIAELQTTNYGLRVINEVNSMREATDETRKFAVPGDVVLLSPGAASFGIFKNEYDRGDQFVDMVRTYAP